MRNYKKPIMVLIAFVFLVLFVRFLGVGNYLTIAYLQAKSTALANFVAGHYLLSVLIYLIVYAALIACALPVVAPLTMLGGYLFGVVEGLFYAVLAASTGATIYFLLIRYVFAHTVHERFARQQDNFRDKMNQYGSSYLVSLQLLTVIPYFVISTLAALAEVPLVTFIWTTVVGALPLHAIYAYTGRELATLSSFRDILKPSIIVLLLVMAFLAALPMLIRLIRHYYDGINRKRDETKK